ncbi:MAG: DUF302 domain-containing protein [Planctomycetes bacterium]|nr:DUF302 domain-containing protein [Planctomycetota bacterium]
MSDEFIRAESRLPLAEAVSRVESASKAEGFGVLNTLNLQQIMAGKGVKYAEGATVVEICRPGDAKSFLEADQRVAPCLPCRIAITTQGGKTYIHTVRPSVMMGMFQNEKLTVPAKAIDTQLERIIATAAG